MEKRTKIILASIAAVIIVSAGLLVFRDKLFPSDSPETTKTTLTNVEPEKFNYPKSWSVIQLTEADKNAGVLFKLEHASPEANLIIRSIVGDLESEATQDKESLASSISESLKAGIEGYSLIQKKVEKSGSVDILRLKYNQTTDKKTYTNIMAIIPTNKQIFYLTFRATASDFSQVESDMNVIITDFATYVDTKI